MNNQAIPVRTTLTIATAQSSESYTACPKILYRGTVVASAEQVACLLYWFLGHAVWLPGDCAVAIVSVVRTGMARSSLECWLFILSAVAWPEVGVRSAS